MIVWMEIDEGLRIGPLALLDSMHAYLKCNLHLNCFTSWPINEKKMSVGFPTKRVSNQSPQLQRIASELKVRM